ncbi:MAG: sporulation protein YqfD [Clostridia bacterium]|nr:sporulation protein YqfD [Clostridia bacterium]
MVTRDILDTLFGCVEFSAENGFAERFINICTAENIPLWDMHRLGEKMTAKTTIGGYKMIRSPAKRSSMRVRLLKKIGLPFYINRHIKRKSLLAGIALIAVLLVILSGRVWVVEVSTDGNLSTQEIIEAFESAGLEIGKKISTLDITKIENEAVLKLENVSWAAINFKGCVAQIKAREIEKKPEIETHSGFSNIIASKDGQVEILEVYRGSAAIIHGQTVTKGDLIISGVSESKTQISLFTDADGYVVAKTNIEVETTTPKKVTVLVPKHKKIWSFYFLGMEIFPARQEEGICYEHRRRLVINGRTLPFGINYRLYTQFEEKEKTISSDEARLMAINDFALESYNKTLHAQIIDQKVEIEETEDVFTVRGNFFCYENIGEHADFDVEEVITDSAE